MTTTLIVESGHLESGANTFVSLADFKAFSDVIADDTYTGFTDDEIIAALINAATYLKIRYRWRGQRINLTQTLVYPRTGVQDDEGLVYAATDIPQPLIEAQCQAAIRILLDGNLMPDIDGSQLLKRERVQVGSIVDDVEYTQIPRTYYAQVTALVRQLIYSPFTARVVRA